MKKIIFLFLFCCSSIFANSTSDEAAIPIYIRDEWENPDNPLDKKDCTYVRGNILKRDSLVKVKTLEKYPCFVVWGIWIDAYSGKLLTNIKQVAVDHIIPLHWAHYHGGAFWSIEKKRSFAEDPKNLLVTADELNRKKSFYGPDHWLPPHPDVQCNYLIKWQLLMMHYDLKFNEEEQKIFNIKMANCQ